MSAAVLFAVVSAVFVFTWRAADALPFPVRAVVASILALIAACVLAAVIALLRVFV